jgi:hypothetical protein
MASFLLRNSRCTYQAGFNQTWVILVVSRLSAPALICVICGKPLDHFVFRIYVFIRKRHAIIL